MSGGITALLPCQLAGELLARALHLPVPGPVIGMVILFAGLIPRDGGGDAPPALGPPALGPPALGTVADALLANLGLLFDLPLLWHPVL